MNVKHKVQKVGANGGSPAQESKAGSRITDIAKEIYTGEEKQRNAVWGRVISWYEINHYARLSNSYLHKLLSYEWAISRRDANQIHRSARIALFVLLQRANLPGKANNLLSAGELRKNAGLIAERLSSKPRIEYQLQEVDGRDFAHKALIERAKNELELILDKFFPQRVFVIGFKRGHASDLADELGLGKLKELGYQLIFKVTPESNRYLITEVV